MSLFPNLPWPSTLSPGLLSEVEVWRPALWAGAGALSISLSAACCSGTPAAPAYTAGQESRLVTGALLGHLLPAYHGSHICLPLWRWGGTDPQQRSNPHSLQATVHTGQRKQASESGNVMLRDPHCAPACPLCTFEILPRRTCQPSLSCTHPSLGPLGLSSPPHSPLAPG